MKQGQIKGVAPRCPQCAVKVDGWTSPAGGRAPDDGDLTVCAYCGAVARFTLTPIGLLLRPLTVAERSEVAADDELSEKLQRLQGVVAELRRRRP